jgi:rhodanese-related sulfurtransferase
VAFVRLVPLFPFNLLNYALGLTRIKLSHYIITSYLCMLPGALAYTYLGYVGREAAAGGDGLIQKGMLGLALLALVAFLPRLINRLRQKPMLSIPELKQRLDAKEELLVLDVRSAEDFIGEQGHINNAKNISLEELPQRLNELEDYQQKPIILVCRTDRRSAQAAKILNQKGFNDVQVAKGGMTDWNQNHYPLAEQSALFP